MLMYYYLFDLLNYQMFHNEKVTLIEVVRNNLLEIDKHILQTYHIHLLMEIYQENNLSGTSL